MGVKNYVCPHCGERREDIGIYAGGKYFCSAVCVSAYKLQSVPFFSDKATHAEPIHPLEIAFRDALSQATGGKGSRHGGGATPFYKQQWVHRIKHSGIGFATGQAGKKLDEAAERYLVKRESAKEDFERELLGSIVYAAMAYLASRGYPSE
jgi:hypothetical protein